MKSGSIVEKTTFHRHPLKSVKISYIYDHLVFLGRLLRKKVDPQQQNLLTSAQAV